MGRDFDAWLATFKDSIATYEYYTDFDKVYKNVDVTNDKLQTLESLLQSQDIKHDFETLIKEHPEIISVIPLLLAVRPKSNKILIEDEHGSHVYDFESLKMKPEEYSTFMERSGLFGLLTSGRIHSLIDYAHGIEVGLDSNARKNRGGHLMEDLVEQHIQRAGFMRNSTYFKEMYIHEIEDKYDVDLSAISNQGKTEKRFDYVVFTPNQLYLIETNFYSAGGSKLNETARSYKQLSEEIDTIPQATFLWFTDGHGWASASNNLRETFDVMPHVYNINDLSNDVIKKVCCADKVTME